MKVTEVIVTAGRTFNHPYEQYANLKPGVTLKATLDDGDDPRQVVQQMQAQAEELVEQHKHTLLGEIKRLHRLEEKSHELASLAHNIRRAQSQMDALRQEFPELTPLIEAATSSDTQGEIDE